METQKQSQFWKYLCLLLLIIVAWLSWKYIGLKKHSIEYKPSNELLDSLATHHLDGTSLTKEQVTNLIRRDIQALSDMYMEAFLVPPTRPISKSLAIRLHEYYVSTEHSADSTSIADSSAIVDADSTRAIFITLKEIFSAMATVSSWPGTTQLGSSQLHNSAFYAYLVRHDKDSIDPQGVKVLWDEQTSVAIQLARVNSGAAPTVIEDKILDLGDLCPPKCPSNEQIKPD